MDDIYVATVTVFERVSADYDVAKRIRTKILTPTDTVKTVMDWANDQSKSMMGRSDVIIAVATPPSAPF